MENYLPATQVAKILGVTRQTVRDMILTKKINAKKVRVGKRLVYLISKDDVEYYLREEIKKLEGGLELLSNVCDASESTTIMD
jgi:excisionase family DNA binding protein